MALRGRRHWLAIDGLGGPSYKFPQFLAGSGIVQGSAYGFTAAAGMNLTQATSNPVQRILIFMV